MTKTLAADYPEAAPYIQQAVTDHGEAWVLEHYYEKLYPLAVVINMSDKDELPFYDDTEHEMPSDDELTQVYQAWVDYRENLRTGTKPSDEQ